MAEILSRRLQSIGGCILENLYSSLVESPVVVLQAIALARGSLPLHIAILNMPELMIAYRELSNMDGAFSSSVVLFYVVFFLTRYHSQCVC